MKAVLDGPLPGVDSLIANALESLRCFDEVAATCGYHQNRDKLVGILSLVGKNSRKTLNEIAKGTRLLPFKCALASRSLGSQVAHDARSQPEVNMRLAAVKQVLLQEGQDLGAGWGSLEAY